MYKVYRRTFEAKKHPPGSAERAELNKNFITSEYYTGSPYAYYDPEATQYKGSVCRTKAEAQEKADHYNQKHPATT